MEDKLRINALRWLFCLMLMLGLLSGMRLTAYADSAIFNPASTYTGYNDLNTNNTEVTISEVSGKKWYVIGYNSDAKTVTLLSKQSFANKQFNSDISKKNVYETSEIKTYVDGLTAEGQPLAGISSVLAGGPTLIDASTAENLSMIKRIGDYACDWWLSSPGTVDDYLAAYVGGINVNRGGLDVDYSAGVRPALKLKLDAVSFDSESNTFSISKAETAYSKYLVAKSDTSQTLPDKVVHFKKKDWYIIADDSTAVDAGTVTLLAKDPVGASIFDDSSNAYSTSTVRDYLDGLTNEGGSFAGVKDAIDTVKVMGSDSDTEVNAKLWLLSVAEANQLSWGVLECSQAEGAVHDLWWLRSPGTGGNDQAAEAGSGGVAEDGASVVNMFGVRPALKLKLDAVSFDPASKTFSLEHTHSWNLTANKDTATVKCTAEGCPYQTNKEYTAIIKPTSTEKTYDGTATTATVTKAEGFPTEVIISEVTYKKDGKTVTDTSNVGSYTAEATVSVGGSSQTITTNFEITQKSLENVNLTLDPNTYVYDGNAKTPTITVKDGDKTLVKDQDYTIDASSITSATALSTGSGYPVKVNGKGNYTGSQTAYWTITKNPTKVTTLPTASAITYGQTLEDSALTPGVAKTADESQTIAGTFTWTNPTTKPEVKDSNSTEYDVTFTPNDTTNYDPCSCKVKLTVNKADPEVTAPKANVLKYSGKGQELVTKGEAVGGTMYYAVTTENTAPDDSAYSTTVPKGKNAGTYYVWYKVKGDANHKDTTAANVKVTIAKKTLTVTANNKTITYGDAPTFDGVTYDGFVEGEDKSVLGGELKYTCGYSQFGRVGEYSIFLDGLESINYDFSYKKGTLTVVQKEVGLDWENTSFTYDTKSHVPTATATGTVNLNQITVKVDGAQTDAGTYTATASALEGFAAGNYKLPENKTKEFTIAKAIQTITADNVNAAYGDKDKKVNATTNGDGAISYAVKQNSTDFVDVGTDGQLTIKKVPSSGQAYVIINAAETANYYPHTKEVTIYIKKKGLTITPNPKTITYGDAPANAGANYEGFVNGDGPSDLGFDIQYTYHYAQYQDVGEYYITLQGQSAANYTITLKPGILTVEKREAVLRWSDTTSIYDGYSHKPTATVTNTVNDDTIGVTVSGEQTNAGENYTATATALTGDKAGNYQLPTANTTPFTIKKAESTPAQVAAGNRTYDGTDKPLVTVTGEAAGGTMQYVIGENKTTAPTEGWGEAIPTGTDAGTYYVWSKVKGDANHHDTNPVCTEVTIAQKALTITAEAKSKTYGEDDPVLTYTQEGLVNPDKITGELTRDTGEDVGAYDIRQGSVTAGDNYTITYQSAKLTINKADPKVTAPKANELTYNGQEQELVTKGEAVGGDMQYAIGEEGQAPDGWGTAIPKGKDAKIYYVWYKIIGDANHKNTEPAKVDVTIARKALTITAEPKEKIYGEADPKLTYTQEGLVDTDNITGDLTRDAGGDVGAYDIRQGSVTAGDNYTMTYQSAKLTINKAESKVTAPEAKDLTYNKEEQALVTEGKTEDGTIQYALGENDTTAPTDGWGTAIPKGKDAKAYYVWYKVIGDKNHKDSDPACVNAAIAKADAVPAKVTANHRTYDGTEQPLASVDPQLLDGGSMRYVLGENNTQAPEDGWQADIPAKTTAGTYYLWSKVQADANHNDSDPVCTEVTIAQKDLTITADSATKEYDGKPLTKNSYTNTELAQGDAIESVTVTGSQTIVGKSDNVPKDAVIKRGETDATANYNITYTNGTLTVTDRKEKYDITVAAKSASYLYDGKEHSVSGFETLTFDVDGVSYTVSGLSAEAKATEVGKYPVKVTGKAVVKDSEGKDQTAQFNVKTTEGTLTITEAAAEVVTPPEANDLTYNGQAQELVTPGEATGGTMEYALGADDKTAPTEGWGAAIPTGTDAGTYYVWYKVKGDANHNDTEAKNVTAVIAEKKSVSYKVTFVVKNGAWNDGETADKTVTLTGKEGDELKLKAEDIPTVGDKPAEGYKVGKWDTEPKADTVITADTTYTYTYAQKEEISYKVTFKVLNGAWNDATAADQTVTLTGKEGDELKLKAEDIPAVGEKPAEGYKVGAWDVTPNTDSVITADTTYTYRYADKDSISRTVTFKVVGGAWDDTVTADKTVTLFGKEGDTLKLTAEQIPAVGNQPDEGYKAGAWDVEPSPDTAITADTTYTYTYARKEQISATVTFKVAGGAWNDGTTTEKAVVLSGYEGDILKLKAEDIPAVGNQPDKGYKAGSWDVTPSPDTVITADTTYTYTYVKASGQITSEIVIGDNLPNMKADGFDDTLTKKLCTPEELKRVDDGEQILYTLKVDGLNNPPAADKALCEQEAANIGQNTAIDLYMDISIYKKVGDAEPVKVTDTKGNMITVSFDIPAHLLQTPANTQRAFYIIRVHDGQAQRVPATVEGGRISFQTDQFSAYALAHQDTVSTTPVNPVNPANGTGIAAATGIQGNGSLTIALIIVGLALIIGVTAFVIRKKQNQQ